MTAASSRASATAFAPASVGNVAVGFDILGHTVAALGDRVRATRRAAPGIAITSITGVHVDLPIEAEKNTAGMAVLALQRDLELPFGFELEIEKGIPLGSGLGGSAASAVAAIVAAAALVDEPLDRTHLLKYAMQGEAVASGSVHVDNIAPSLFGGLVLTVGIDNPFVKQIPVPDSIRCVLVHPHMVLATREARAILSKTVPLADVIWQQANLAGFLAGCFSSDLALIRESLLDVVIEPQRQVLIPGFGDVKQAALGAGALGASISGAGPSVFAWADQADAEKVRAGMVEAFARHGLETDSWVSTIDRVGARVVGGLMQYQSTRDASHRVGLGEAIGQGLAPDGGLYVPTTLPKLGLDAFVGAGDIRAVARVLLRPFAEGDVMAEHLPDVVDDAFVFPVPVVDVAGAPGPLSVLELFHGPTAAFKDFGARFLAATLERLPRKDPRRLTILVATSGDTGGAVAAAFYQRPWVDVVVLYPKGLVSRRQEQQLACWGRNVRTLAVHGSFDDCQRMVKEAFVDASLARGLLLSSANSINVGRLLPQMAYYAVSSLELYRREGRKPNYIVPSGNLGNVAACLWAREVGLPIGEVVLATNANLTVPDYLRTGEWQPRPSLATLASAMDVGNPSNMERLRGLYGDVEGLRAQFSAHPVSDDEIRAAIRRDHRQFAQTWCPHTATAAHVYRNLTAERRRERWVLVSTAHPAKFNEVVEPLVGAAVPVPPALGELLSLPSVQRDIAPTLGALRAVLRETTA